MSTFVKSMIAALALSVCSVAIAGHRHGHGHFHHRHFNQHHFNHHHWNHHHGWIAPVIIGGALGYALTRPNIVQAPIVEYNTLVPIPANTPQVVTCSEWREVLNPDGNIVKERTCTQ